MARLLFYSTLIVLLTGCADSQFLEWLGLQKKHDNKIPVAQAGENIQITLPEVSVYVLHQAKTSNPRSSTNFK